MNKIYLGKSGLFKRERVLAEARKLLSTENLESHPDFLMVEPDGVKIGVAQAEKIVDFLSFSSVNADRKVIVIDKAHTGTVEFQQSILKLLEDGAVKADFLLTAQKRLLETIHSRCTTVSIEKWRKDEMIAWIAGEQLAVNETALLLAGGRPGIYRELISDTSFLETAERLKNNLVNAPEKAIIQLGALAEGFETIGIERHALLIGFMEESLLEMVLAKHRLSVEQLLDAISVCSEERALLGKRGYGKVEMFRFYRGLHSILSGTKKEDKMNIELMDEIPFRKSCMKLTGTKDECEKKLNEMKNDFGESCVTVIHSHDYKNIGINRYECLVKVKIGVLGNTVSDVVTK